MIRVLIVEDKPLILRSIRDKIQNYGKDIVIAGEATDGEAALAMIPMLKPDIVFTDIRMPVIDGIKLISEIRKRDAELPFVIISGYDEFDYARQAMKLNVSEYLLKPIRQEEINEVLRKTIEIINSKKQEQTRNILQDILNSNTYTLAEHSGKLDFDRYYTLILNAGPYSNFVIDYANPFNNYWSAKNVNDILSLGLEPSENHWIFDGRSFNELVVVLGLSAAPNTAIHAIADSLMNNLPQQAVPVTIVVSREMKCVQDIGIETQFCRALLRKNLIFGKSGIFFREKTNMLSEGEFLMIDTAMEKRLLSNIQNNQRELFYNEITRLFSGWERNDYPQSLVERLLKQIIKLCRKAAIRSNNITDLELETDEVLSSSRDYSALFQSMTFIFDRFFPSQEKYEARGDFNKTVVKKVEEFLQASYSDPITINDIAKMFNLHPAYLSRIFKHAVNVSPMEYLTTLRIQKAKEMILSEENLAIKDIAEIVGYSDPFYFSRIFKTITGKSPSEYKASNAI